MSADTSNTFGNREKGFPRVCEKIKMFYWFRYFAGGVTQRYSVLAILCNHGTVKEKRKKVTGTVVWVGGTIVVFFIKPIRLVTIIFM